MTYRSAHEHAALVEVIAAFLADLDPSDRAILREEYVRTGLVDARYDRQLLARCGDRLRRTLTTSEKATMRHALLAGVGVT